MLRDGDNYFGGIVCIDIINNSEIHIKQHLSNIINFLSFISIDLA